MNRKSLSKILIGIIVTSLLLSMIVNAAAEDTKISSDLEQTMNKTVDPIKVIILLTEKTIITNRDSIKDDSDRILKSQESIMGFLNSQTSANDKKIKQIWLVNAIAAEITPDIIQKLAERSDVESIIPDYPTMMAETSPTVPSSSQVPDQNQIASIVWGVQKINAPAVWAGGINGAGVKVAVLDTGIDATHPDLNDLDDNPATNDPKLVGWKDYINGNPAPYDDHGHGTHVSGTISGTGANGQQTGVAPGSNLMVAKIFNSAGYGSSSNVILAMQWAVTNGGDVISYSGGSSSHNSAYTTAINNVIAAGIVPVIAAGNSGPGTSTVNCPGDETQSFTIGATDSSDVIAGFSSRGPSPVNGGIKPDVSAPGVSVLSTVPGGGYASWDGTSMATPHVSGAIALMLQHNPSLTPAQIKQTLESTSLDLGIAGKDNTYGSGRIDAYKAVFGNVPPQGKKVAIYQSEGAPDGTLLKNMLLSNGYQAAIVSAIDVENGILSQYDVFVYGHGTGVNSQVFKDAVASFKANGGGIITEWISSAALLTSNGPNIIYPIPNWGWYQGIADYGGSLLINTPIDILDNSHPVFQGVSDPFAGQGSTEYFLTSQNLDPRLNVIAQFTGYNGKWPAVAVDESASNGINVLFYEGHIPSGNAPGYYSTSDIYQNWVNLLNSNGMTVSTSTATPLTLSELNGHDVVIIAEPTIQFTQPELDALNQYVSNGGGLLVLGEYGSFAIGQGIYGTVNGITNNYGINFSATMVNDAVNNDGNAFWPIIPDFKNSVVGSVDNSVEYAGASLELTGAAYPAGWASPSSYITGGQMNALSGANGVQTFPEVRQAQVSNDPNIDITTGDNITSAQTQVLIPKGNIGVNKKVLWDLTHGVFINYEPSGDYSTLVGLLSSKGYTVDTINNGILNVDMSQYSVLVINLGSAWDSAYSPAEVQAISNFVQNGGSLLVMGDNPACPNLYINPVAQQFGTTLGISDLDSITSFGQHPIFNGVSVFSYAAGGEINAYAPSEEVAWSGNLGALSVVNNYGNGKVVLTGDINFAANEYITYDNNQLLSENIFDWLSVPNQALGPVVMGASEYGNGKVLAIGDGNLFSNQDPDEDGTISLLESDNELLALNTIKWLAGGVVLGNTTGQTRPSTVNKWGEPKIISSENVIRSQTSAQTVPIISDPAGDNIINQGPIIDIIKVEGGSNSQEVSIKVVFSNPMDVANTMGYISLDTDQNPGTGFPPSFGKPEQNIGADYEVLIFNMPYAATVDIYDTATGIITATVPVTFGANDFMFTVPLSALGNDDGNIDVTTVLGDTYGPTDWAPDAGYGTIQRMGGQAGGKLVMFFFDAWDEPDVNNDIKNLWLNAIKYSVGVPPVPVPDILVDPTSFSLVLPPDATDSRTLTIQNTGSADLTFQLTDSESGPLRQTVTLNIPASQPQSGEGNAALTSEPPVPLPASKIIEVKNSMISNTPVDVLLLGADNSNTLKTILEGFPDINTVGQYKTNLGTPTLAELQEYNVVIVWSNYQYLDKVALGNVLADYVDSGGKVIIQTFSWYGPNWDLQGRIITGGYSPFVQDGLNDNHYSTANLGTYDAGHPIMTGVNTISDYFRDSVVLTSGSQLVASWDDGEEFIAAKGSVIGINSFPGDSYQWTGDYPTIIHNTILWSIGQSGGWLSESPISGTVAPGGSWPVNVLVNTAGLESGNYHAQIVITSNDPDENPVSVPVNLTVENKWISVVIPNGGENWRRGTTELIIWDPIDKPCSYVKIELLKPGLANKVIVSSTLNDGSHPWLIPATQLPGVDYKVKITCTTNLTYTDTSDKPFTILTPSFTVVSPNGGENYTRGTTQTIRWNSTENPKSYVKIELLKPGVANKVIISSTLNDGSHPWLIPGTQVPGTDYKIKITSTINASVNDISDYKFTIVAPSFTVVSPNGDENWTRGTTQTIRWNSTENPKSYVKIELLKPGVANKVIISSTLNDGSHPWLIPAAQLPGDDYKIKITSTINASVNDTSDDNFIIPAPSFTVVSPNGDENWTRGTTQTIRWNSTENPKSYVKIELLKPGVANKVIIASTLNDGSHPWLIPATQLPGDDYKVKITSTINASLNDTSNNNFSIVLPKITVTSPNGGENWTRGTAHAITWNYTGNPGTYVKIELLKNEVVNRTIFSSTPNDKSQSWTIPTGQAIGSDYKVRITSTTNAAFNDTSNSNFNISAPP